MNSFTCQDSINQTVIPILSITQSSTQSITEYKIGLPTDNVHIRVFAVSSQT